MENDLLKPDEIKEYDETLIVEDVTNEVEDGIGQDIMEEEGGEGTW